MALRFACVGCGKQHRIPDDQAGLPGKCGRCGRTFVAPGIAPAPAPAAAHVPLTRVAGGVLIPAGIAAGVLALALVAIAIIEWARREPTKAAAPPPVVAAPAEVVDSGTWTFDVGGLAYAAFIIALLAAFALAILGPLLLPVVLSRRGWLSVGRWACLAALSLLLAASAVALVFLIMAPAAYVRGDLPGAVGVFGFVLVAAPCCGAVGCLVAGRRGGVPQRAAGQAVRRPASGDPVRQAGRGLAYGNQPILPGLVLQEDLLVFGRPRPVAEHPDGAGHDPPLGVDPFAGVRVP